MRVSDSEISDFEDVRERLNDQIDRLQERVEKLNADQIDRLQERVEKLNAACEAYEATGQKEQQRADRLQDRVKELEAQVECDLPMLCCENCNRSHPHGCLIPFRERADRLQAEVERLKALLKNSMMEAVNDHNDLTLQLTTQRTAMQGLSQALRACDRIELLRDAISENCARINHRGAGTSESIIVSRNNVKEHRAELKLIRDKACAALAAIPEWLDCE